MTPLLVGLASFFMTGIFHMGGVSSHINTSLYKNVHKKVENSKTITTQIPTPTITPFPEPHYLNYGWYMHDGQSMQYIDGTWYTKPQQKIDSLIPTSNPYINYGWYTHNGQSMQYVNGSWYLSPQQDITPTPQPPDPYACPNGISDSWCDFCKSGHYRTTECLAVISNR